MAFDPNGFRPAAGTTGIAPRIHTYRSPDSPPVVETNGYFNPVRTALEVGDLIYAISVNPTTNVVTAASLHVVVAKAGGNVNVSDATVLTLTNTD